MARISVRISDEQEEKLKKIAKDKCFITPSGEKNISQVIRLLIDKEEN